MSTRLNCCWDGGVGLFRYTDSVYRSLGCVQKCPRDGRIHIDRKTESRHGMQKVIFSWSPVVFPLILYIVLNLRD